MYRRSGCMSRYGRTSSPAVPAAGAIPKHRPTMHFCRRSRKRLLRGTPALRESAPTHRCRAAVTGNVTAAPNSWRSFEGIQSSLEELEALAALDEMVDPLQVLLDIQTQNQITQQFRSLASQSKRADRGTSGRGSQGTGRNRAPDARPHPARRRCWDILATIGVFLTVATACVGSATACGTWAAETGVSAVEHPRLSSGRRGESVGDGVQSDGRGTRRTRASIATGRAARRRRSACRSDHPRDPQSTV